MYNGCKYKQLLNEKLIKEIKLEKIRQHLLGGLRIIAYICCYKQYDKNMETNREIPKIIYAALDIMRNCFGGTEVKLLSEKMYRLEPDEHAKAGRLPILYYNIETQTCKVVRGEFCVVQRECKSEEEIRKFVESINFLFHISVVINSKKPIEEVLSEAIKESYDKIKDNLEPPL